MKKLILVFLPFIMSCSSEDNKVEKEVINSIESEIITEKNSPLQPIIESKDLFSTDFTIEDYFTHFFTVKVDDFRNNTRKEAFDKNAYLLLKSNINNGFMAFSTVNTPPEWDGDSKTEYAYEIAYWNKKDDSRIIAVCETEVTWVSATSKIIFYLHDETGINEFNPLSKNWTMNDFVNEDISTLFSDEIINNPPVEIFLPNEGKEIRVNLALDEYYEPYEVFEAFLKVKKPINSLKFTPITGEFNVFITH